MNKLILIGNGFDLAHGLKTSYKDFILWYLNKTIPSLNTSSRYEDDIIKIFCRHQIKPEIKTFRTISGFFKYFSDDNYSISFSNAFFKKIFKEYQSGRWVDIEAAYYETLLEIYKRNTVKVIITKSLIHNSVKTLNNGFKQLMSELNEYIQTITVNTHIRRPEISEHLLEIVGGQNTKTVSPHFPPSILIVNFNYTDTIKLYHPDLGEKRKETLVINIHGNANESLNPIVFGYGDEMDPHYHDLENLNMNFVLDFFKSFHYLKGSHYHKLIKFINSRNPYTVYIMGHSCGISDRVLLNTIFEHHDCQKIKIYYHQRKDRSTDFFEKTQEISRHFKPENKGIMRERIVSFDKCVPLT